MHANLRPIRALAGLLLLLLCASAAAAATGDYFVYIGTYTLRRGKGIYTFRFQPATGQVTAVLDFHATPENPQLAPGRYTMSGNFSPNGTLVLRPDGWVTRPAGSRMVGLNGKVDIL